MQLQYGALPGVACPCQPDLGGYPRLGAISQLNQGLGHGASAVHGRTGVLQEVYERGIREGLLKFSLIIVASVPVLRIYRFVQKYFARGVMIGSIKG